MKYLIYLFVLSLGIAFQNCSPTSFDFKQTGVSKLGDPEPQPEPPQILPPVGTPPCSTCEISFSSDSSSMATVAFEDKYPNLGDADYNDFVANFNIKESLVDGKIQKITLDFIPKARGAGFDHKFLLIMDGVKDTPSNVSAVTSPMFNGSGQIKLMLYDGNDQLLNTTSNISKTSDLVIFGSTKSVFGGVSNANVRNSDPKVQPTRKVRVEITLDNPASNPAGESVDIRKYRMMLRVVDTNQDIDLININPDLTDADGYPYGFVVPVNWKHCLESEKIYQAYGFFEEFRSYLQDKKMNPNTPLPADNVLHWYDYPTNPSLLYNL